MNLETKCKYAKETCLRILAKNKKFRVAHFKKSELYESLHRILVIFVIIPTVLSALATYCDNFIWATILSILGAFSVVVMLFLNLASLAFDHERAFKKFEALDNKILDLKCQLTDNMIDDNFLDSQVILIQKEHDAIVNTSPKLSGEDYEI